MSVTIIIPTLLQQPELLARCLVSLFKLDTTAAFEILISVNSTKEVFEKIEPLQKFESKCLWLFLNKNTGFTGAVNAGISNAKTRYIVLLNDDTEVTPRWLEELLLTQQQTGADMVASTIFLQNTKQIDSQGFTYLWRGKAIALKDKEEHFNYPDHWLNNRDFFTASEESFWQEPFGPDAAAALYTKKLFDEVGTFDPTFFAYLEDVELALRARKAHFKCALAGKAVVYHHKHATSKKTNLFKEKQDLRNWWKIVMSHYTTFIWSRFGMEIVTERLKNISGLIKGMIR